MMGQEHEKAALLIQRRARGNMARKEVRAKKNALDAAKQGLPSADDMTDEDMRSIVKLQSMARMKKEKEKRQRQVMGRRASFPSRQKEDARMLMRLRMCTNVISSRWLIGCFAGNHAECGEHQGG